MFASKLSFPIMLLNQQSAKLNMDNVLNHLNAIDNSETSSSFGCKIEDLKNILTVKSTDFTLVSQNIRGIYANFDDFQANLSILNFNTDLIILSECQINPD